MELTTGAYAACRLHLEPQTLAWTLNRAMGTAASSLLAITTATGALWGRRFSPAWLFRAYQAGRGGVASGLALTLGVLHRILLAVDLHYAQTVSAILNPGHRTGRLGTLGLYGVALVALSAHFRRHLSPRVWTGLHLTVSPAFALLTAYGSAAAGVHLSVLYGALAAYTFGLRVLDVLQTVQVDVRQTVQARR